MTALYIILAIAAVIAIIIYIPIDVAFAASYYEKENKILLGIKYFLIKIQILPPEKKKPKKPKKKKQKEEETEEKEEKPKKEKKKQPLSVTLEFAKEVIDECMGDIINLIKHLFTHTLQTKKFLIKGKFGTGNPMYTGLAYGGTSAAVYNLVSFIDRHSKLYEWSVDLTPDFNAAGAEGETEIIIRTRIAYILKLAGMAIVIGIKILLINRRVKRNAGE